MKRNHLMDDNNAVSSQEALTQLWQAGRQTFATTLPKETFDALTWDVRSLNRHAKSSANRTLYFTHYGTTTLPLPQHYAEVIKCWIVLESTSIQHMVKRLDASRLLWKALLTRRYQQPNGFAWQRLCEEDLSQAELLMREVWAESSTYAGIFCVLHLANFLAAREICPFLSFTPQTPHVASKWRYTLVGQEQRRQYLPSPQALQGLADIYSTYATDPPDRLCIAALAILVVTGLRIGELLTLPANCEIEEVRNGQPRYGLRYYREKSRGGELALAVRWLTEVGAELTRKALAEILTITAPFRQRALVLEKHPTRVPIPSCNWADQMTQQEVSSVLGFTGRSSIFQISSEKLPWHMKETTRMYQTSDVETYLMSLRVKQLWTLDRGNGTYQRLSETLLIAPRHFFCSYRGTNSLLIEPMSYGHLAHFLSSKSFPPSVSAFERFGIKEDNGTFCQMTSHQFRHWLNDVADKGGLPVELQTRWMGRSHPRDTEAYRHATGEERLQWVKEGIRNGSLGGMMADVYFHLPEEERDSFLEAQIQAVHVTALGICIHDFSIDPCPYHLNCVRGCRDYLRRKGNQQERTHLLQIQRRTQQALEMGQARSQAGSTESVEPWLRHYQETLAGVETALAVDDDPTVSDGTLVQPFKNHPSRFQSL